jgi:hypothetical protein
MHHSKFPIYQTERASQSRLLAVNRIPASLMAKSDSVAHQYSSPAQPGQISRLARDTRNLILFAFDDRQ